jgi:uncharacterized BrkB/YihY/UPF0761 family membrane protein
MDERGLALTFDAVLALIPVLIVLMSVANLGGSHLTASSLQISHQAQDSLDLMAQYRDHGQLTILEEITTALESNHNNATGVEAASLIAGQFLNKTIPGMKYVFIESKQLNKASIASNGDLSNAENLGVSSRSYGNYTFQLYVWSG